MLSTCGKLKLNYVGKNLGKLCKTYPGIIPLPREEKQGYVNITAWQLLVVRCSQGESRGVWDISLPPTEVAK